MKQNFIGSILFFLLLAFNVTAVNAEEVVTVDNETILTCYADGSCCDNDSCTQINSGSAKISAIQAPQASSSGAPVMNLQKLSFSIKDNNLPVQNKCVGLPMTLHTFDNAGNKTGEVPLTFWSMPTDSLGKIFIVISHSGVMGTCSDAKYKMTFDKYNCVTETPENLSAMGCCQITLRCGLTFCYSVPAIYSGYGSLICEKLGLIFGCLGLGSTEWSDNAKCNHQTGKCEPTTLITLAKFEAQSLNKAVTIKWSTGSEIDNIGFNLYRSTNENEGYVLINSSIIPAKGSPTEGASYSFTDDNVQNRKTYFYKLEDIDLNGTATMHGPVSATPRLLYGLLGN